MQGLGEGLQGRTMWLPGVGSLPRARVRGVELLIPHLHRCPQLRAMWRQPLRLLTPPLLLGRGRERLFGLREVRQGDVERPLGLTQR